jgi:hypothetical protein
MFLRGAFGPPFFVPFEVMLIKYLSVLMESITQKGKRILLIIFAVLKIPLLEWLMEWP